VPSLKVDANTYLYERVHTFPEVMALGTLRVGNVDETCRTLMIYQEGGKDFQVKLSTFVDTNDPQFSRRVVPVFGQILKH
jgi:hypothetical protein